MLFRSFSYALCNITYTKIIRSYNKIIYNKYVHITNRYNIFDMNVETEFNNIIKIVSKEENNLLIGNLPSKYQFELYKYYKQATLGDCSITEPDKTEYIPYLKWMAWNECKGISKEDAMKTYVQLFNRLLNKYCLSSYFTQNNEL